MASLTKKRIADEDVINVLFLTSDNEFSGIIYSIAVGKIFS